MLRGKLFSFRLPALVGIVASSVLLTAVTVHASPVGQANPGGLAWERDYGKAVQRAGAEDKPIIAYMFTDWCELCKRLDRETFVEPQLIEQMGAEYVWLKLNTESEEDGKRLQEEFTILTYPTILVLDSEGEEIDRISRFLPSWQFRLTVNALVHSPDSLRGLRNAVQEQPDSVPARYALAEKFLRQNNYVKAEPEFRKVTELDPLNHEGHTDVSHYNIALSLASQARFDEALRELDLLESRFPGSVAVADTAGVLREQIHHCCSQLEESEAALRESLNAYPAEGRVEEIENLFSAMEAETSGK